MEKKQVKNYSFGETKMTGNEQMRFVDRYVEEVKDTDRSKLLMTIPCRSSNFLCLMSENIDKPAGLE